MAKRAKAPTGKQITFASAVVPQAIQQVRYNGREYTNLANVEHPGWEVAHAEQLIDFDVYVSVFFLNARIGAHQMRLDLRSFDDGGVLVKSIPTSPIEVPGRHYRYAVIVHCPSVAVPPEGLFLAVVIDELVCGASAIPGAKVKSNK